MGNAGARHQLVTRIISAYPRLAARLSWTAGATIPHHAQLTAGPTTHERGGNSPLETDVTVRAAAEGKPVSFVHVEMQGAFTMGKFLGLRAYHGSEVLKSGCGGTMVVLSRDAETTARFRAAEAQIGRDLDYRAVYLSGHDLTGFAAADRPFEERALAAALADYTRGAKAGTLGMLREMDAHDPIMGDLFAALLADECPPDDMTLEEEMSPETFERLQKFTAFKPYFEREYDRMRVAGRAEGMAQGRAEGAALGRAEGMAQGKAEGAALGKVSGEMTALLAFFAERGDNLSLNAQLEIAACSDPELLLGWLLRAFRGESAAAIFDSELASPTL